MQPTGHSTLHLVQLLLLLLLADALQRCQLLL
jgi:hypothetical protein